jgi:hypothetical protein
MTEDPLPPDLLSTPEAARFLGVPEPEFTRLASALELPVARPGSKTQPRLWNKAMIEALHNGPEGAELREAVVRKQQIEQMLAELAQSFPQWRDALKLAADALFNFNRLAKWASCSRLRCRELYELKEDMIRLFYEAGHCRGLVVHSVAVEEECSACSGTGTDWQGQGCATCAGSGLIPASDLREYLSFCFQVQGNWYFWHTPRKGVHWPYQLTPLAPEAPQLGDWKPLGPAKPLTLAATDFLRAEALIRFVLRGREEDRQAERAAERQQRYEENRRAGLARQAALKKEQSETEPS